MQNIQQEIKQFYDKQAKKFSQTRKRNWPEFKYITEEIENIIKEKGKIKILELGCGDGRLYRYLINFFDKELIEYTGIDLSSELIKIAKKENPEISFINEDMLSFLEKQNQQSYDFVIAVASFQHIPTRYERLLILKNIYRILNYGGTIQMFNWSFSKWFIKKYNKEILKSIFKYFANLGIKPINDIYIPWKDNDKTYYRYYHIFFMYEIKNLFKRSGFNIKESYWINNEGKKSVYWIDSRNTMITAKKDILK